MNVFCQCNSSSRRSGWSCRDGVMAIASHWLHQAMAFGEQLAAAQLFLCIFFTCPLTMKSWQPTAPSLLLWVHWQPLDGGISPGFFFSLFLSLSQDIQLIGMISYRIVIYAKLTVSFRNIQSRKKLIRLKLPSLSNSYFKREIYTSWQSFDVFFLVGASSPL